MLAINLVPRKKCRPCGQLLPVGSFCGHAGHSDGLNSHCRACKKAKAKAYYQANRDAVQAQHREYNDANPERKRAWDAAYYEANKDRLKAKFRLYRRDNRERLREMNKAYYISNFERISAVKRTYTPLWRSANRALVSSYERARKARKLALTVVPLTQAGIAARVSVFGDSCAYCGGAWKALDHVKPLSRGGPHCLSNLRPACVKCNSRKHAMPAMKWLSGVARTAPLPLP